MQTNSHNPMQHYETIVTILWHKVNAVNLLIFSGTLGAKFIILGLMLLKIKPSDVLSWYSAIVGAIGITALCLYNLIKLYRYYNKTDEDE